MSWSTIGAEVAMSELSWLTGFWRGSMGDNTVEEIWGNPTENSIQASVRILRGNVTLVHEVVVINKTDNGVTLFLQQWDTSFKPLNPSVTMQVIEVTQNSISFAGNEDTMFEKLTYRRVSEHRFEIAITPRGQPEFVMGLTQKPLQVITPN